MNIIEKKRENALLSIKQYILVCRQSILLTRSCTIVFTGHHRHRLKIPRSDDII